MFSMKSTRQFRSGFTLVELLLVSILIIFLSASAVLGILRSQRAFRFNSAFQQVGSMVREARSLAVTGRAVIDYTDYDLDGCRNAGNHDAGCTMAAGEDDKVTPAHYGIHFNPSNRTLTLFADMHGSGTEGQFDGTPMGALVFAPGQDMKIAEYTIDPTLDLLVEGSGGMLVDTVMYSPIFADTAFYDSVGGSSVDLMPTSEFFVFGIRENIPPAFRDACLAIHPIAGVAETTDATSTNCP